LENSARDAKLGLWALPKALLVEPWVWRKMSAEEHDAIRAMAARIQPETASPVSASKQETFPLVCGARMSCREMATCDEALFHLEKCGLTALDGDGDGIPCETICR
jgi:hypothetical protein